MINNKVRFPVFLWLLTAAVLWGVGGCGGGSDSSRLSGDRKQEMPPPPPPPTPPSKAPTSSQEDSVPEGRVYTFVEEMPSFPGGEDTLKRYLSAHIRYPASARKDGHSGTVVVQFNVARDGSLHDIVALPTGVDAALRAEAVRIVRGMPRWTPGRQAGRTVVVRYSLPVRFVLQ